MACTATATKCSWRSNLESGDEHLRTCLSPDRPNIYEVKHRTDLESDFGDLVCSLQTKLVDTPRVIVYCQSLNTCSDLFAHFLFHLGPVSYYPPGSAEEVSDNRLFGMYHSCTLPYGCVRSMRAKIRRHAYILTTPSNDCRFYPSWKFVNNFSTEIQEKEAEEGDLN